MNYVRVFAEIPGVSIALVCDADEERLRAARQRYSVGATATRWEEALAGTPVDAAVIATPAATHFAVANRCLELGKHVLVEKPLATRVADAETLVRTSRQNDRVLMVGHTFIYNSGVRKIKEILSSSTLGRLYYLHATRTNMGPIRQDVNTLWDLASHDVAIFNYLLGARAEWVSAVGSRLLGNEREDVGFATLAYPGGILANLHASWLDPNKVRRVVVVGSRQRIVFDDLNDLEPVRIFEKGVTPLPMEAESFGEFRLLMRDGDIVSPRIEPSEPLRAQAEHFVECVTSARQPLTDGASGLEVVRVLSAMDQSLEQKGAPVAIR
jgi:predicted dehydrogenase